MGCPRLGQHGQGLAQGCNAAGHQGGADRFDTIAPEQLQQSFQLGKIGRRELRKSQAQAAVDLQIHPGRAEPVAVPVVTGGPAIGGQRLHQTDQIVVVKADAPALVGAMAAALGLGQSHIAEPAHGQKGRQTGQCHSPLAPAWLPSPLPIRPRAPVFPGSRW